jgi:hypothetical protein
VILIVYCCHTIYILKKNEFNQTQENTAKMYWSLLHDSIAILSVQEDIDDGTLNIYGYCAPPSLPVRGFHTRVALSRESTVTNEACISINMGNNKYNINLRYGEPFTESKIKLLKYIDAKAEIYNYPNINLYHYTCNDIVQINMVIYGMALTRF